MIINLLTIALVSVVIMLGCFRLSEAYPWILETKAKFWLMMVMLISSAVSAISFLAFIGFSVGKYI